MEFRLNRTVLILPLIMMGATTALAMPAPLSVKPGRISAPLRAGAVIGGNSAEEFSLIGIQASKNGSNGARIALAYGDRLGKPQKGETGYFHVQLDHDARRIVIDLAQVHMTLIDPTGLAKILAPYKIISSSEMTMDPADGSTNITLNLSAPVKMKAGSDERASGDRAEVVLEIEPTAVVGQAE